MKTVLFACVHNAGRTQMAAALFNQLVDPTKARAISAGTHPAERVHPEVVDVVREIGVDLKNVVPKKLTEEVAGEAHILITMTRTCAPFSTGARGSTGVRRRMPGGSGGRARRLAFRRSKGAAHRARARDTRRSRATGPRAAG